MHTHNCNTLKTSFTLECKKKDVCFNFHVVLLLFQFLLGLLKMNEIYRKVDQF